MAEQKDHDAERCDSSPILSVSDEDKELAVICLQEFEKGSYELCISTLSKLLANRSTDFKVNHNKAVAEYYQSGLKKTDEFKQAMAHICSQAHINIDNIDSLDDVDHCVIYYNQAIILYYLKQYRSAITILDKLFQFIEPLEENLAKKVCMLLLDLYLCIYQPEKALGLIGYIEKMWFSTNNNGNKSQQQTPEKDKEKEKENIPKDINNKENNKENKEGVEGNLNESLKPKLQQYKARCYILLKSMKACKREIKGLMNSTGMNLPSIYLKSNFEYLRGNYRKSMKVLNSASSARPPSEIGECIPAMYYNNIGCIHFYLCKPHLGTFYFRKALQENENALKELPALSDPSQPLSGRLAYTLGISRWYELIYNLGIQLLYAGKPLEAFDCLIEAVQVYHTNPRLWLRLAECCIAAHKPANEDDFKLKERKHYMVDGVVGAGPHRKIVLSPGLAKVEKASSDSQSAAMPMATLEFGALCLKNALSLLPEVPVPDVVVVQTPKNDEVETATQITDNFLVLAPPGNPMRAHEVASLRCSILAAGAYVALCLGDNLVAYQHAQSLINQPKLSGAHKFLGHLYSAEALILLDRIADAIQFLSPDKIKDISLEFPFQDTEKSEETKQEEPTGEATKWYPYTLTTAKVIMQYNLTVAYALRGEFEKASENLRQVGNAKAPGTDIPMQAVMLALYIQLQLGHADHARGIIKQNFPQFR